jgi:hypothetical protein
METIENKRTTITPAEDLHFCKCGKPADMSCTDAVEEVVINIPRMGVYGTQWLESAPRYGCKSHPVQPMITFADGRTITAREYEDAR